MLITVNRILNISPKQHNAIDYGQHLAIVALSGSRMENSLNRHITDTAVAAANILLGRTLMKRFIKNPIEGYLDDDTTVLIYFDHSPAEPMILSPNEDAYPGCDETADVTAVTRDGVDIMLGLDEEQIGKLEDQVMESLS